jgi:hypothetical protein
MNMKLFITILLLVFVLLGSLIGSSSGGVPPRGVTTTFFQTQSAGFYVDLGNQEIRYLLGLKILRSFKSKSFVEVYFENPADPKAPFVVTSFVGPESKDLSVRSPGVTKLKKGNYYNIDTFVYKDESKKELITKHSQTLLSNLDDKSVDTWLALEGTMKWSNEELNLEFSYPSQWNVKEINNRSNFQVFFSIENIDVDQYYSTGIMVVKMTQPGLKEKGVYADHKVIDDLLSRMKVISESRKEIITEHGYEGVISKVHFVNPRGIEEKEWIAVFSHQRKLVVIFCEAPKDIYDRYDKIFYSIIVTARLY